MRTTIVTTLFTVLVTQTLWAEPIETKSRVLSVGLFKNGLAVITRELELDGAGTYLLEDVPNPVHGTFWVESEDDVQVRVTQREQEVSLQTTVNMNFQNHLSGKKVLLHFKEPTMPPLMGKVVEMEPLAGEEAWNRSYEANPYGTYWRGNAYGGTVPHTRFLLIETEAGMEYVDMSLIARISMQKESNTLTQRKPVMLFTTERKEPMKIQMTYLAKGLSWAPSYKVDISDKGTLTLAQKAVIKNELLAFEDAEVYAISGYPSIEFGHVVSPLSLQQTWANFFQQLNADPNSRQYRSNGVLTQRQAIYSNVAVGGSVDNSVALPPVPVGEGPDIHYQTLGTLTMAEGDSLVLTVDKGKAEYDRIVEWIVPDTRKANGRRIEEYEREQNPQKYQEGIWDALLFNNPFSFPMTTGAAVITGNGRFLGERTSFWVNPKEETTLHITKAFSIRTKSSEEEEPDARVPKSISGNDFYLTTVKGELLMKNHRKERVTLRVRRQFSGELVEATDDPSVRLREEGVYFVNKRNELTWDITLNPGEEHTLTYRYEVLVDR